MAQPHAKRPRPGPMLVMAIICSLVATAQAEDDGAYWRWAREREIPSLAYVDSWVNYAERFGGFRHLPDEIAVIDEPAREGLVSLGAPPDRVHLVGNPAFDALSRLADEARGAAALARTEATLEQVW